MPIVKINISIHISEIPFKRESSSWSKQYFKLIYSLLFLKSNNITAFKSTYIDLK